ncbi:MAG TPA: carboxypeptidase regulatory-like domain-containing protein [Polyangiaceae bacterium]|nr:carboxypeptidase regulatory-like domain-containing protein [Polyangiaceae bacterium]
MCPDRYSEPARRQARAPSLARGGCVIALMAACSPTGASGGASDAPTVASNAPVTPASPGPTEMFPPADPPPVSSGDSSAAGQFIDPDDMPVLPAAPIRRRGLKEKQVACPDGGSTTVSGTVYIPSGELTLYNAMVYVPDAELRPFTPGASCGCEISGEPIASALTDADGHFVLENVPVGSDIPLVVQVGEWRREFDIGTVEACTDKPIPDQTLRLPARQSEGDIPKIAVATGFADALECLVRKLGIAPEEFTHPRRDGRVNLFAGYGGTDRFTDSMNGGEPFPPSGALWADLPSLQMYDVVLLSCDSRAPQRGIADKDPRSLQAMYDYLNGGGRLFASHYQEVWFQNGPAPFPDLATYVDDGGYQGPPAFQVVTDFPKGQAMAEWALANGASTQAGEVPVLGAQRTILSENSEYAQRWLTSDDPETVQYLSANTPLGASDEEQCGRVVLSDLHVSPGRVDEETRAPIDDLSEQDLPFPEGCVTSGFSPQEKLLAFMLFDISACVVPDSQAPAAPPIIR